MSLVIIYVLLGLITLLGIVLLKAYLHVPPRELKRRARRGDNLARLLFSAASYGPSLELLLWGIIGLSATGFFLVIERSLPAWVAAFGGLSLLWVGFAWLPNTPVSKPSLKLAQWLARPLAATLQRLYPVLNWLVVKTGRWRLSFHTGLYEKEDLIDLLEAQAAQADSHISLAELSLARNSLLFGDKVARDIMTPKRQTKTVSADDTIGPVLMTELHDSGQDSFAVRARAKSPQIVGVLHLRDLVESKHSGTVRQVMRADAEQVNDDVPLDQALQIFIKSKQHLLIVVNDLGDWLGVLTLEDVLTQIVGQSLEESDEPVGETEPTEPPADPASKDSQTVVESE